MPPVSPLDQPHSEALDRSQQTVQYLQKYASTGASGISIPLVSHPESAEAWLTCENLLLSSLRVGDDQAAHLCLEKLINRFGATNERIMSLRGLYQEAVAKDVSALEKILNEYNEVLRGNPSNAPVAKRRIALLRILSRTTDAIDALTELLASSPTDIEAWTELSALYFSLSLFPQAIFCLEEVLLIAPNAWNIQARLGEALYISVANNSGECDGEVLVESVRRFCRSIELCHDYLRGYYGLKLASDRLLSVFPEARKVHGQSSVTDRGEVALPSTADLQRLNEHATTKLAGIAQNSADSLYDQAEIVAARELLGRNTQKRER